MDVDGEEVVVEVVVVVVCVDTAWIADGGLVQRAMHTGLGPALWPNDGAAHGTEITVL